MATQEFDATQIASLTIGDNETSLEDITFTQGTGQEGEPALTSLVISYGNDSIILTKYFTAEVVDDETNYVMTDNAVNTFFVAGQSYTFEWKQSNVFATGSAYAGDNTSYGDGGAMYNIINGFSNNQVINAVEGMRNWINGGEGRQIINGRNEYDMLAGNENNDTIKATFNKASEIYGGEGNDKLTGSLQADWISGNEGNDTITGGEGDDWLFGGDHTAEADPDGKDIIYGGDGADNIYGRGGDDKLYGNDGSDAIYGGDGNDTIVGGEDNDTLTGGNGSDSFIFDDDDGYDIISDATSLDTIKFDKEVKYKDIVFSQGTGQTEREPVTSLLIKYGDNDTINIQNYFTAQNVVADDVITSFNIEGKEYDLEWKQSPDGTKYGMFNIINGQNYTSSNGIRGVKVNSKNGGEFIIGSQYNDTINIKAGNNEITETAGTNKITTGNGIDVINVSGYSTNIIKAGSGANQITLDSTGINKVTAGNGNDTVEISGGSNTLKLGNGENLVTIGDSLRIADTDSVNTITTGKNKDDFIIFNGNNAIKSGSGNDDFTISGGYSMINSGNGEADFTISGGVNIIKSGKNKDEYKISDGQNTVNSGKGGDLFTVTGGSNVLNGNSGIDTFKVSDAGILADSSATLISAKLNGGSGSDIYNIDQSAYNNILVDVTDKSTANSLIVNDKLDVYFNVTLGSRGKHLIGNQIIFTDGFDSDNDGELDINSLDTGVSVTGKNYKAISNVTVNDGEDSTKYTFDIRALASDVAGWLTASGYKSSADVLASGNDTAINNLLGVYAGVGDYTGSSQCYTAVGVA